MLRGSVVFITAGIMSLGVCSPLGAQNSAANGQNSVPAASTTAAPVTTDQTAAADKKDSATPSPATKPKKVWTNDDMGDLHQNSTVSVVGKQKKNTQPNYRYPPAGQTEYMVKMYRQQIDQLEAQADGIEKQIANLQDAMNGKTVDSSRKYDPWGGRQGDWSAQIAQLEKSKENIQKQIDSIQEQIKKLNP
jgi:hypothetical protein